MLAEQDHDELLAMLALPLPGAELVRVALRERKGDRAGALELLGPYVRRSPEWHLFRHGYGLMLERAGREEEAVIELRR
ncbi:MAG: hypothetical protein GWM88_13665, partial [Pseudomonadales bacterium]|nr:hypothetical protein [Pseudomonadales bacterium]NIX08989.1 hypothetical protein [Pseudomonadales bacterium]